MAAAAQGVSYIGSFFIFIQRFTVLPRRMAILQLASAIINAAAMVASVVASPTVGGYVVGLLASSAGIAVLNAVYTIAILRLDGVSLFGRHDAVSPAIDRRVIFRFVAAGNLLGYVKLLHRSADVLLVAAFCGDRADGHLQAGSLHDRRASHGFRSHEPGVSTAPARPASGPGSHGIRRGRPLDHDDRGGHHSRGDRRHRRAAALTVAAPRGGGRHGP